MPERPPGPPWLSLEGQLIHLRERGLTVPDSVKARHYLAQIGFHRLSGYWDAFRERSKVDRRALEHFKPGARFDDAVNLYVFDKKLRLLAMDALERIEVAVRVAIAHALGEHDPAAYLQPHLFHPSFSQRIDPTTGLTAHHRWLARQALLVTRSREDFVLQHRERYGLPLAIWVASEVWDFGCLSQLFAGMRQEDQDVISRSYGVSNGRVLASWLHSLNYLRNVCAHHSRLWNRNIVIRPKLPPAEQVPALAAFEANEHAQTRAFLLLCICHHMIRTINPASTWGRRMKRLLDDEFPRLEHLGLDLWSLGADSSWRLWEW